MANHARHRSTSFAARWRELFLDDDALAQLARDCWNQAEPLADPTVVEAAARHHQHHEARRPNPVTHREHWAIWLMAQRLCDTSVYDPARRCVGECEKKPEDAPPGWHCPVADDRTSVACARSLVFPYRHVTHAGAFHTRPVENQRQVAKAIARGLACIGKHHTVHAIRQSLRRFPEKH